MKKVCLLVLVWQCCVQFSFAQEIPVKHSDSSATLDTSLIDMDLLREVKALLDSVDLSSSFFSLSVGVGNRLFSLRNNSFNIQQATTNRISITPTASYFHKTGLNISGTAFMTFEESSPQFYQYALSPGYDYMKGRNTAFGVSYTHYFTKDDLSFYATPFQNEVYGYITTRKGWLRPGFSVGWAKGSYRDIEQLDTVILGIPRSLTDTADVTLQDFSMVGSVSHLFKWDDVFTKRDNLSIVPQFAIAAGMQQYDTEGKGRFSVQKRRLLSKRYKYSSSENTGLSIQSLSMSLNVTYFIGKFAITPQYYLSYYFPESDQKFINIFSVMAGITL